MSSSSRTGCSTSSSRADKRRGLASPTALLAAAWLLAACGFTPVYQQTDDGSTVAKALADLEIAPATTRTAQLVRNALLQSLATPSEDGAFRLEMSFDEQQVDLAIQLDDSVTRRNLILRTSFVLRDTASNNVAFQGRGRSFAAYNLVESDYANLIAERDARQRAAKDLAYQIRTRLLTHFATAGKP